MNKAPRVIYNGKPKKNSWCRWSVFRVMRRNNSTNVRFVGDTGSGKSWSAVAFAETCAKMMGKKFTCDDIYFSIREVLDKISEEDPKPGTIFLIDEQQVEANAKDHQAKRSKAYSLLLSTVRSKRYIIITTLPFSDMELKQVRRFFHVEVETHGANISSQTVRSTPRYMEYSRAIKDKVYRKRLLITFKDEETGNTKTRKLSFWDIPRPSEDLIQEYETKKKIFQQKLYKRLSRELAKDEGEDEPTPKMAAHESVEQTLTEYQAAILDIMRGGVKVQKEVNLELIKRGFNSNKVKVSTNLKWMRKKGVVILR